MATLLKKPSINKLINTIQYFMLLLAFVVVIFGILMAVDTVRWDLYHVLYVCSNEPEQPAVALSAELTVTLN
jgi:hypothetical protein